MIPWVDALLSRWGRWSVKRESSALGYGAVSPMFRDCPPGGGWSAESDPGFTPIDVLDCDAAVSALPLVLRVVVVAHYQLRRGSLRATAAACGVSHKTASQYLHQAQEAVQGRLQRGATGT